MAIRFRSFVPLLVSGVLALVGWWCYSSRKKAQTTSDDDQKEEHEDLISSEEDSNETVHKAEEQRPTEQAQLVSTPELPELQVQEATTEPAGTEGKEVVADCSEDHREKLHLTTKSTVKKSELNDDFSNSQSQFSSELITWEVEVPKAQLVSTQQPELQVQEATTEPAGTEGKEVVADCSEDHREKLHLTTKSTVKKSELNDDFSNSQSQFSSELITQEVEVPKAQLVSTPELPELEVQKATTEPAGTEGKEVVADCSEDHREELHLTTKSTVKKSELNDDDSNSQSQFSSELITWEVEVPKDLVQKLNGKQGKFMRFLKQKSGAKVYISTLPYTNKFYICHVEGTQQQVYTALVLIDQKLKPLDLNNLCGPSPLPLTKPLVLINHWLPLHNGETVEVTVLDIVSAGHVFIQQHNHPTYPSLSSLDQQMSLCYSQPGAPALPLPDVDVICAAPAVDGSWWRAQIISLYKNSDEVKIQYVDHGGYNKVKIDALHQIRSDFLSLPFQGLEVFLDNIAPLSGEDQFSAEAHSALEQMTRGKPLLLHVTGYNSDTGLPLVQMMNMVGDEPVMLNHILAERGFVTWLDNF